MFTIRRRDGYTLMELLTVIAIIGVLAALIFPVAAGAKRKARSAQCMNNMYQIFTAIKQFQLDEHRYPEFIAGPVQFDAGGGMIAYTGTEIIPIDKNTGMMGGSTNGNGRVVSLYPEYISSLGTLRCPFRDLNGDSRTYTTGVAGDPPLPVPEDIVEDPMFTVLSGMTMVDSIRKTGVNGQALYVYKYSSYDYQKPPGSSIHEVHYSLVWKDGKDPIVDPNITRQLKWRTPDETTVITWCSHHRSNDSLGAPLPSSKDICLFLDGHVKQVASPDMAQPWTDGWWRAAP